MSSAPTLIVEGVVRERVAQRRSAPTALFFSFLAETLSVLPTAPDTVKGGQRAKFIKGLLLVIGLLIVLAGYKSGLIIALGVCIMCLAAVVPVGEMWKRDTVKHFRKKMFTTQVVEHPATLTHDGRRLILEFGGERLRRVLTNRAFSLEFRTSRESSERTWVGVSPSNSKKKRDAIWMLIVGHTEPHAGPEFSAEQADTPVVLDVKNAEVIVLLTRLKDAFSLAT